MSRLLAITVLLFFSCLSHAVAQDAPFSTAIVVYQYSGGGTGTETVYIDKANNRINVESSVTWTMMGKRLLKNERKMFDGKLYYTFNFDNNTVIAEPVNQTDAIMAMYNSPSEFGPLAGTEQVLDRECQLYKGALMSACFWNGITLKETMTNTFSAELNHSKEVVNIMVDVPIPEDKFAIDSNMRVLNPQEAIEEMQAMFKKR